MRILFQLLSAVALIGVIMPPVLFCASKIDLGQVKIATFVATLAWFVVTPLWMGRQAPPSYESQEPS